MTESIGRQTPTQAVVLPYAESQAQAIRLKEQQKELEERVKEEERKKRAAAVEVLINKYHYSAKNASIFYNMHKDEIAEFGIDYLMRS